MANRWQSGFLRDEDTGALVVSGGTGGVGGASRALVSIGANGTVYANGFENGLATGQISGHRMPVRVKAGDLVAVYGNWGFGGGVASANDIYVACAFEHPVSGLPFKAFLDTGAGRATISPGGIAIFRRGMPALPDGDYEIVVRTWYATPVNGGDVPVEWSPTNESGHERWLIDGTEADLLDDVTPEYPANFYYSPNMLCSSSVLPADTPCIVVEADSNVATHANENFFERALALLDDVIPFARLSVAGGGIAGYVETNVDATDAGGSFWRLVGLSGGTHAVLAGYTNSLAARTAAQLITDTELTIAQYALFGFEGVILCTAPPHLDGVFTNTTAPADQVIDAASEPTRVDLNDALRAGDFESALPYWVADVTTAVEADISDALTLNGGYWQTGTTQDGTHIDSDGGAPQMAVVLADAIQQHVLDGLTGGISQADITPPTPAAPVNTVAPAITPGTCDAGDVLTCSLGTWTGYPVPSKSRQWKRNGSNIVGETSATYVTVDPTDVSASITCTVTATNTQGSASTGSNTVTPAAPAAIQTPLQIFGTDLHQWNRSTSLGTNASSISSWTDSNTGGANALAQATGANQPVVATVNSIKVARFDGTNDRLLKTYASSLAQPFEIWMVCKMRSGPDATNIKPFWTGFSPDDRAGWNVDSGGGTGTIGMVAGSTLATAATGLPSAAYHAWRFTLNGGTSSIAHESTSDASGAAGANELDSFTVGMDWSSLPADIDIAEIVVVKRVSTGTERTNLLAYLATVTP